MQNEISRAMVFNQRVFLPPGVHLVLSEDIFGHQNWEIGGCH